MNMTVNDVLEMFCFPEDQEFELYDGNDDVQDNIYKGYMDDCPDELLYLDVLSIDNIYYHNTGCITFNVDTSGF